MTDAKTVEVSPHLSMGFDGAWICLNDVLPLPKGHSFAP